MITFPSFSSIRHEDIGSFLYLHENIKVPHYLVIESISIGTMGSEEKNLFLFTQIKIKSCTLTDRLIH